MSSIFASRRTFLKDAAMGLGAFGFAGCAGMGAGSQSVKRPNILFIIVDDPGYFDFTPGAPRRCPTPHVDSIAANGTRFTDAYTTCFVCSPSRAGMLTGRYQNRFGFEFNPGGYSYCADNFGIPESEITIADVLRETGYHTGFIGKWHVGNRPGTRPLDRGFDEVFGITGGAADYFYRLRDPFTLLMRNNEPVDEKEYLTDAFSREAVSFIERNGPEQEPFFLLLSYTAVHFPWMAPDDVLAEFPEDIPEVHESNAPGNRRKMLGMIRSLDNGIGRVFEALRRTNNYEDTLIFFVGDNGGTKNTLNRPLNGYKFDPLEGGLRVPFAIQWPGHVEAGGTFTGITSTMDVFATAVAAAGGKMPNDRVMDSVDLLPYLEGKRKGDPHETLCWRYGNIYAIRHGDWKYIRWQEEDSPEPEQHIYNLGQDLGERRNLYGTRADREEELACMLDEWERGMIEPLWSNFSKREAEARRKKGLPVKRDEDDIFQKLDAEIGPIKTR